MHELTDRDERFIGWWCCWYPTFCGTVLGVAERILPRRLYVKFAIFVVDIAEPMGEFAGSCYCNVRDAGDILRWLVTGKAGP
jgi:hypothetical protein